MTHTYRALVNTGALSQDAKDFLDRWQISYKDNGVPAMPDDLGDCAFSIDCIVNWLQCEELSELTLDDALNVRLLMAMHLGTVADRLREYHPLEDEGTKVMM